MVLIRCNYQVHQQMQKMKFVWLTGSLKGPPLQSFQSARASVDIILSIIPVNDKQMLAHVVAQKHTKTH